jgi:hypothetical protein
MKDLNLVFHCQRRRFQTAQGWSVADRGRSFSDRIARILRERPDRFFPVISMVGNDTAFSGTGFAECALPTHLILAINAGGIVNSLEIAMKRTKVFAALAEKNVVIV